MLRELGEMNKDNPNGPKRAFFFVFSTCSNGNLKRGQVLSVGDKGLGKMECFLTHL